MAHVEMPSPSPEESGPAGSLWLILACSLVAIVVAVVQGACLLAQQAPTWLVVGAGLAVFPFLPLLWHALAEPQRGDRGRFSPPGTRFGLRSLAIAVLVFAVSLGALGSKRLFRNVGDLAGHVRGQPTAKPQTAPPLPSRVISQAGVSDGLESFIPADATLAVGLSGSAALERLLAAYGVDSRNQLAALATCRIDLGSARVLIATRGRGTRMVVVRAPGITDERNLYCQVGIMGRNRLQVRSEGSGNDTTLFVNGISSRQLAFRLFDPTTVIATDPDWEDTAEKKLLQPVGNSVQGTVQGHLAPALARLNRVATFWVASVEVTGQGNWDLALDGRQEGALLKVQGSAVPPSGDADRAELSLRVPLTFTSVLPEAAAAQGMRGVVAALAAASASLSQAQPAPAAPAGAPDSSPAQKADPGKAP